MNSSQRNLRYQTICSASEGSNRLLSGAFFSQTASGLTYSVARKMLFRNIKYGILPFVGYFQPFVFLLVEADVSDHVKNYLLKRGQQVRMFRVNLLVQLDHLFLAGKYKNNQLKNWFNLTFHHNFHARMSLHNSARPKKNDILHYINFYGKTEFEFHKLIRENQLIFQAKDQARLTRIMKILHFHRICYMKMYFDNEFDIHM